MRDVPFDEAVAYLRQHLGRAYAFIPQMRKGRTVGAGIYMIEVDQRHIDEPEEYDDYTVCYAGGPFDSSCGEEEVYNPDSVPEEANRLLYSLTDASSAALDYETGITLYLLEHGLDRIPETIPHSTSGYEFWRKTRHYQY